MLWVRQSTFRPKHKRKNWYYGGRVFNIENARQQTNIRYETCCASGAGSQHVNTTDSALRAVDVQTGVTVRVASEHSQHANKN
jgi:peptide chain release factor